MAQISNELVAAAQAASATYNIPVGVILAFAGNETSYGTAGMGASKNNVFGIGNKSYNNITESVNDFAALVTGNKDSAQSKKYGNATKDAATVSDWVTAITKAGYNSVNPNYIKDTMNVYESHKLSQYDNGSIPAGSVSDQTVILTGSRSDSLKWWGDILAVLLSVVSMICGIIFVVLMVGDMTGVDPTNIKKSVAKKMTERAVE